MADIDAVRLTPEYRMAYLCRCGEPVSLPVFAQAEHRCWCGRLHHFDCEQLTITRPRRRRLWPVKRRGTA